MPIIRNNRNSGVVLIVALWILAVLTMLALGLANRIHVDIAMTKYAVGKMKARYAAWAGVSYAMGRIKEDTDNEESSGWDDLYQNGFYLAEGEEPEDIFRDIAAGDGHFTIAYTIAEDGFAPRRYGFQDEESRLNLNMMNPNNFDIFKYLIIEIGATGNQAEEIASAVVDWKDSDGDVFHKPFGAEEEYYWGGDGRYHCKNGAFENIEELMLVKGMSREIYEKLKPYVTVFPARGRFRINLQTVHEPVLRAAARDFAGQANNTRPEDAASLARKILAFRRGPDGLEATRDDRQVDRTEMNLTAKEDVIFRKLAQHQTRISRYLVVSVTGTDQASGISSFVTAGILRDDLSVFYWKRGREATHD